MPNLLALMLVSVPGWAALPGQEPTEDPAHAELRALRDGVLGAMRARDLDALLSHLHPRAVVAWQNAEVSRGREAFAEYYRRMMVGPESIVTGLEMDTTVDELSILHGDDTAIAFGSSADDFELRSGLDFHVDSRWSATLVREDGRWLVAGLHASCNLFDNPLLSRVKGMIPWIAGATLLLGGVAGFVAGRRRAA